MPHPHRHPAAYPCGVRPGPTLRRGTARARSLALAGALAVLGCASVRAPEVPALPPAYIDAPAPGAEAPAPDTTWWRSFEAPELDALVDRGLRSNRDLEAGVARVEQARAAVRAQGAALRPQLGLSGRGSGQRAGGGSGWSDDASTALDISYELDLFGARRQETARARAAFESDALAQQALELTLQGDIAEAYFTALALQERLEVAEENLRAAERVHAVVVQRHAEGASSGFELARQTSALAAARARIPALEQARRQNLHALAVLAGAAPQRFALEEAATATLSSVEVPTIAPGLPAELLLRRPDLASAEAALRAADADIAVARAAFLPRIDLGSALTGAALTGGSHLVTSLSGGLAAPIWSGGRLRADLERTRRRRSELLARYRGAILVALREVEDARATLHAAEQRAGHAQLAASEAARAFELALLRYREGADDLLSVLDAQRQQLDATDTEVQVRLAQLTGSVRLFRALGGGWRRDDGA